MHIGTWYLFVNSLVKYLFKNVINVQLEEISRIFAINMTQINAKIEYYEQSVVIGHVRVVDDGRAFEVATFTEHEI